MNALYHERKSEAGFSSSDYVSVGIISREILVGVPIVAGAYADFAQVMQFPGLN